MVCSVAYAQDCLSDGVRISSFKLMSQLMQVQYFSSKQQNSIVLA